MAANGPVVLITGCSTGIGRELARHLTGAGCTVVATARRTESLAGLPAALCLPLDVERTESVEAAVQQTLQAFGRIDVLVNNAGYGQFGALEEVTEEQLHKVFEVNVHGPMRLIRAVAPHMRRQGSGRIINLSSVGGLISFPLMGAYCGTKFAVEAMSDSLRAELAPFGIHVILIEPGAIRTEFETTAKKHAETLTAHQGSPYRALYRGMEAVFGRANASAPGPEAVANGIRRAILARRPKARYQVPLNAVFTASLIPFLPARLYDWAVGQVMKRLGR